MNYSNEAPKQNSGGFVQPAFLLVFLAIVALSVIAVTKTNTNLKSKAFGQPTYADTVIKIAKAGSNNITDKWKPLTYDPGSYYDHGHACTALLKTAQAMKSTDRKDSRRYKEYALAMADSLITNKDKDNDGIVGWGLAKPYDYFGDGTIDPAHLENNYTTAIVDKCLAEAHAVTREAKYIRTLRQSLDPFREQNFAVPSQECVSCTYVWPVMIPEAKGRMIRNRNMLMGMVMMYGSKGSNDNFYRNISQKMLNAELYEINVKNFFGYTGYHDPQAWYYNFPVTHTSVELLGLDELGRQLNNTEYLTAVRKLWDVGVTCGGACLMQPSDAEGGMISCQLARHGEPYLSACKDAVRYWDTKGDAIPHVTMIGLLSALPYLNEPMPTLQPSVSPCSSLICGSSSPSPTPVSALKISPPVCDGRGGCITPPPSSSPTAPPIAPRR